MSETFGIRALKPYHTKAMAQFLQKKMDVFVNLLTGCARSPIYISKLYRLFSTQFLKILVMLLLWFRRL